MKINNKSQMFLTEMIIVIFFFSLAAGICVGVFAKARKISNDNRNMNKAVLAAQSAAESFKSYDEETFLEEINAEEFSDGVYKTYYDKNWNLTEKEEDSGFTMTVKISKDGSMVFSDINVAKNDGSIFELGVKKYDRG